MPGVCPRCNRPVYFAEQRLALGKVWHAFCFSCRSCRKLLDSRSLTTDSGELFCGNCSSRHSLRKQSCCAPSVSTIISEFRSRESLSASGPEAGWTGIRLRGGGADDTRNDLGRSYQGLNAEDESWKADESIGEAEVQPGEGDAEDSFEFFSSQRQASGEFQLRRPVNSVDSDQESPQGSATIPARRKRPPTPPPRSPLPSRRRVSFCDVVLDGTGGSCEIWRRDDDQEDPGTSREHQGERDTGLQDDHDIADDGYRAMEDRSSVANMEDDSRMRGGCGSRSYHPGGKYGHGPGPGRVRLEVCSCCAGSDVQSLRRESCCPRGKREPPGCCFGCGRIGQSCMAPRPCQVPQQSGCGPVCRGRKPAGSAGECGCCEAQTPRGGCAGPVTSCCRPKNPRPKGCCSEGVRFTTDGTAGICCCPKPSIGCECLGGGPDCQRCGRKVYQAEMQMVSGVPYHNICFSCYCCRKPLEPLTYQENCGEIYCKQCYVRNFGPQGYGYGAGAGVLQTPL